MLFRKNKALKLEIDVKRVGEEFVIKHKDSEIKMPLADFSMKKVAELTGVKYSLYATKPSEGKDYNEMLKTLKPERSERKQIKYGLRFYCFAFSFQTLYQIHKLFFQTN